MSSDPLRPPNLGPRLPVYPGVRHWVRAAAYDSNGVYFGYVQQSTGTAGRDRTPCYLWEANGIAVGAGTYKTRLIGSYDGLRGTLPLFFVGLACCAGSTPPFDSSSASSLQVSSSSSAESSESPSSSSPAESSSSSEVSISSSSAESSSLSESSSSEVGISSSSSAEPSSSSSETSESSQASVASSSSSGACCELPDEFCGEVYFCCDLPDEFCGELDSGSSSSSSSA